MPQTIFFPDSWLFFWNFVISFCSSGENSVKWNSLRRRCPKFLWCISWDNRKRKQFALLFNQNCICHEIHSNWFCWQPLISVKKASCHSFERLNLFRPSIFASHQHPRRHRTQGHPVSCALWTWCTAWTRYCCLDVCSCHWSRRNRIFLQTLKNRISRMLLGSWVPPPCGSRQE